MLDLAFKSLRNRRLTAALTVLSIALSVTLLLGVERIRQQAREGFTSTISGTDLVVGARSSPVHLLLFSVFRIGNPNNNLRWDSYQAVAARPGVAWTIPLSLGDSHRGYRVLGTSAAYFEHLRYARDRRLGFIAGVPFAGPRDAVLGAEVARALGYGLGREIVVAHGTGEEAFVEHSAQPFRVTGILARTGTPADRTIHVSLEGIDAIHADTDAAAADPLAAAAKSARSAGSTNAANAASAANAVPGARDHAGDAAGRTISAFLVGLKSRAAALPLQRWINEFPAEPLTAVLPGVTLLEVWDIVGAAERALLAVSVMVVVVGLAGMLVALLTGLNERRREMAVLRSVGARPVHVFALILGEAGLLTVLGLLLGVVLLTLGLALGGSWLEARFGLVIEPAAPSAYELGLLGLLFVSGILVGTIPALRTYQHSLADGMTIRL